MHNRPPTRIPGYRRHAATGQARVTIDGRDHYLGVYNSPESKDRYRRLVAELLGRPPATLAEDLHEDARGGGLIMEELLAAFLEDAERRYIDPATGRPSSELAAFRVVLRHLRRRFAMTPAAEFGPLKLKAVQRDLIDEQLARKTINQHCKRVVRIFKWAVSQELLPAPVWHALQTVEGVKEKEAKAKTKKVEPVPGADVEDVIPHVSRQVAAMIELQLLTGARPGELVRLRPRDIDEAGPHGCWAYRPEHHKTEHHGHARVVYIGPRGQAVLAPFLIGRAPGAPCFSPAEAERERNEARSRESKSRRDVAKRRTASPDVAPGDCYTVDSYRRAIERGVMAANAERVRGCLRTTVGLQASEAIKRLPIGALLNRRGEVRLDEARLMRAGIEPSAVCRAVAQVKDLALLHRWHPHQLRHSAATSLRAGFGVETAQVALGHRNVSITEVYAEKNLDAVARAIAKVG